MVEYEYGFVYVGAESGRPWGTKAEGFTQAPHLNTMRMGMDIVNVVIAVGDETGNAKTFAVGTLLVPDEWKGAQLRLGTTDAPLAGIYTITSNTATHVTGNWVLAAAASGTIAAAYIVRSVAPVAPGMPPEFAKYPNVRVLTPFQPDPDVVPVDGNIPYPLGGAVAPPNFILPAGITAYEDQGLFLPFAFEEGIGGAGISEITDSFAVPNAHAMNAVTALLISHNFGITANSLAGGYVRATHEGGVSWGRITGHDAAGVMGLLDQGGGQGWLGAGTPTFGGPNFPLVGDIIWEAWLPHWSSNPHSFLPGAGFRYPNHDMQPAYEGDGRIRNLPRGIATSSYGNRFGSMLEFGWRMSASLGKRVNMIPLAVNETTLIPRAVPNVDGFLGKLGWWDHDLMSDWSPAQTGGLADRIKKLITTVAPAALLAESSTKVLRILGIVMQMGDGDVVIASGREQYGQTAGDFVAWLRDVIDAAGLSPYDAAAKIPVVHPLLTADPWELAANDEDKVVNGAIKENTAADGFADTIDSEASPKISFDVTHFNGVGEALNGNLMAAAMNGMVNHALAFGSEIVAGTRQKETDICNLALSHIGEREIISLETAGSNADNSRQADLCRTFYPRARDAMLQSRQWGFAMRRIVAVPATSKPSTFLYGYVVPPEAINVVAVLAPGADDDYSSTYAGRGIGIWEEDFRIADAGVYTVQEFEIEQAPSGHRVVFTNQVDAVLRYAAKVVDANRYSDQFIMALSYALAALLAGSVIKGREGAATAAQLRAQAEVFIAQAAENDSTQRDSKVDHVVPWLSIR